MTGLATARTAAARYCLVGANFHTTDVGFRDRLYVEEEQRPAVFQALRDRGVDQAVILSTCDRTEFHLAAESPEQAVDAAQDVIARRMGMRRAAVEEQLYRRYDEDAVRHLYSVACALDSQVIGESQVLGQVKESFVQSREAGMIGQELDLLYQSGFVLAKQVRTETRIGEGAVTVASVAVRLAQDLHGDPARLRLLVVGLGDVGALLMEQFRLSGARHVVMTGSSRRTERAARAADCHFAPIDRLQESVAEADVVITAAGVGRYLVDLPMMRAVLGARRERPVLLIDCGVPEDVDESVDSLEGAFLYRLGDIERLARQGKFSRHDAADRARRMVDEAVMSFRKALAAQEGVPGLVSLRRHFEEVRQHILDDHKAADAEEATRLLINHLLHRPSEVLREIASEGGAADIRDTITVNRVLARLFDIAVEAPHAEPGRDGANGDEK